MSGIEFFEISSCYSDGATLEENAARLLRVTWMTFPIGIFFTTITCFSLILFQKRKFSDPYAQAILIQGIFGFNSQGLLNYHYPILVRDNLNLRRLAKHEVFTSWDVI